MARGNVTQHQNDYWASYIGSTVVVTVDGTVHHNPAALPPGHYLVYCHDAAIFLKQGGAGGTVGASDFLLSKQTYRDLTVDDADNGFVFVTSADGAGGLLRITRASDET